MRRTQAQSVSFANPLFILCIGLSSLIACSNGPNSSPPPPPVGNFSIVVSPATITAAAGSSNATFTVSTTAQNGFNGSATVTLSGLPAGATTSPASPFNLAVGSGQTVTVSVPATASNSNYTVTATGSSGSLSHSTALTLTVSAAQDFSIALSPNAITTGAGTSNSTFNASITGLNGFTGSAAVTLTGLPAGTTTSPASPFNVAAGSSQTVTLSLPAAVSNGNYTVTATANSGSLTHSFALALTVGTAQNFSIALSPSAITTNAGMSNSSLTVSIAGENGFSGAVAVALSGLPAGVTTSPASPFNVAVGRSQIVTLSPSTTVSSGNYTVTATGNSGTLTQTAVLGLTIVPPLQSTMTTWHYDNARTGANTTETTLTPSNVNSTNFGKLATLPVDGFVVAQPLYLGGVYISGQGVHNVLYVVTMHDSVYAFDADSTNPSPLWMTSILTYSPAGAQSVPSSVQQNATTTGWSEVGIVSTPVIDPSTGTLYLVAETYEGGNVVHRLHALDVTTGLETLGGPATIAASYTHNGTTTTFKDLFQMNRPGLLLANGHIYIAFGSNCCNDYSQGWMLSYNETTLRQEGAFTTEPGKTLASIWHKGGGIPADSSGNIYAETGEGYYQAGTNLAMSVLKFSQSGTTLGLADWFSPYNYQYLSDNDKDLADGVLILPDQPGAFPHELIAIGKEGTIYLLNRDNMGQLCSTCTSATGDNQIVQELLQAEKATGIPVYWNNTVYFTGISMPVSGYTLQNGTLVVPPVQSPQPMGGGGHAILTANGSSNGILWFTSSGTNLYALNATTLRPIYDSTQAANGRDTVPPLAHFATPVAVDGKVFLGTQNSVVVYGLL